MIQSTLVTTDPLYNRQLDTTDNFEPSGWIVYFHLTPNSYFNGSYHKRQTDITDITDRPKFKALFGF